MRLYPIFAFSTVTIATATTTATSHKAPPFGDTPYRTIVLRQNANPTPREQTTDQQILHALNRLAFGPRPGDVQTIRAIGVDAWINQQLHPEHIHDPAVDQLLARYPMLAQDQNELAAQYADFVRARVMRRNAKRDSTVQLTADDSAELRRIAQSRTQLVAQLDAARIARAVVSERQLQEVMTDFWENHFNIYVRKGAPEPYYLVDYDRTIREHALGKFRDLLGAVAHSPAMLFYLDNAQSRANPGQPTLPSERAQRIARLAQRNPNVQALLNFQQQRVSGLNENYGRELLELHTLGVDGGYTQQDVINVARALTGWTIRSAKQGGGFMFRPEWHDAADKVILGHTLKGSRGEDEGEEVLDIVARHPATAHFIALKLARRFVSDTPPASLVDRAAHTFTKTDGDIREVVRTIVTSPEFFSRAAYHAKVKSPFEVVVSTARALGGRPDTTYASVFAVGYLGEPMFGHQAPNGYPETGDAWMNTGAILNRINFGMAVGANRLPGSSTLEFPGADSLTTASRDAQVDAVVRSILGGAASPDTRKILLSGEHPLAAAAADAANHPSDQAAPMRTTDDEGANEPTMNETNAPNRANRPNRANLTDTDALARIPARAIAARRSNAITRNGLGAPPKLSGLAQIIGLAIGSPEFQRH